jgi:hypothetical protein
MRTHEACLVANYWADGGGGRGEDFNAETSVRGAEEAVSSFEAAPEVEGEGEVIGTGAGWRRPGCLEVDGGGVEECAWVRMA